MPTTPVLEPSPAWSMEVWVTSMLLCWVGERERGREGERERGRDREREGEREREKERGRKRGREVLGSEKSAGVIQWNISHQDNLK